MQGNGEALGLRPMILRKLHDYHSETEPGTQLFISSSDNPDTTAPVNQRWLKFNGM